MLKTVKMELEIPESLKNFLDVNSTEKPEKMNAMLVYPYIQDGTISYGRAAELIGMHKLDLISLYGDMGIDYIEMDESEFEDELNTVGELMREMRGGLPFAVEVPNYSQRTLEAMEEAKRISRDPTVAGYTNMEDLKRALEE